VRPRQASINSRKPKASTERSGKENREQAIFADTVCETTEGVARRSAAEGGAKQKDLPSGRSFALTFVAEGGA